MNRPKGICLALVAVLLSPIAANADPIWDENVDGDLSNDIANPTTIVFVSPNDQLTGTIGGSSDPTIGDGWDVFNFSIGAAQSLDQILLAAYGPTGANTSTGFNVYIGLASDTFAGSTAFGVANIGTDLLAASGLGPLGMGDWTIQIREFTTPDNVYALNFITTGFTTVSEPNTLALFGLGLGLAGIAARRKKKV